MRRLFDRFRNNRLFVKMFLVMLLSIVAVSIAITWVTLNTSERLFMQTFSITNSKVLTQIETSIGSLNYSIVLATNNMLQSGSIKSFLTESGGNSKSIARTYFGMNQQMKRITSIVDAYEIGITITGNNGRSFATDRSIWPLTDSELIVHPITEQTLKEPKRLLYQFDYVEPSETSAGQASIVASKALMERTTGFVYGAMYFSIREREFKRLYETYTSLGNDVVILNGKGMIISSNRADWIGQSDPDLLAKAREIVEQSLEYKDVDRDGRDQLLISKYLESLDLYLVNVIDKKTAIGQLMDTRTIVLIVIAIVSIALLIVFLISGRLTKSLSRLVKQISTISKYDFDHYVTVGGSYETRQLGQAFNAMLDELHEYVDELVETQRRQRNAELEALQQQINPHFLYNTLASVKFMVQQGSKEKAAETINALISLLQNSISNVSETITISQELVNMRNYVFINHVRYGEKIKVNYFVSPDCMGYMVPKLIIQPFIENAFFHGFNKKSEGHIYMLVAQEGNALVSEIVDNGDGMAITPEQLPDQSKGSRQLFTGIGVRNVHERIKLLYGDEYGVSITSELGEGTKVKIRLPLIKG
ncbi:cache domain-containing sensor histidine kinase [Paenibacillus harenae]|uniref:cache domain-containing sensor histidine kinase n=1 Tax=Paenibacillus harenae TaxID=306543 RepID=UPI0035939427